MNFISSLYIDVAKVVFDQCIDHDNDRSTVTCDFQLLDSYSNYHGLRKKNVVKDTTHGYPGNDFELQEFNSQPVKNTGNGGGIEDKSANAGGNGIATTDGDNAGDAVINIPQWLKLIQSWAAEQQDDPPFHPLAIMV